MLTPVLSNRRSSGSTHRLQISQLLQSKGRDGFPGVLRSQAALARELVDAHRDASKSDADADAQEALLKNAVEKCKAAALRKGDQVVRSINNYHHLRRLREILGNVRGAEKLSAELIDSSIRGLSSPRVPARL
jgi:hypothetical protein